MGLNVSPGHLRKPWVWKPAHCSGRIWALKNEGSIVLIFMESMEPASNLIEGAATDPYLVVYAVVNTARPLTAVKEDIVSYIKELGRVDGLINNTHLGDETTPKLLEGARIVTEAAPELGIPVVYTAVSQELAEHFAATDKMGNPVKIIKRYMPQAFW